MPTTNPRFGKGTTATEVAQFFCEEIRGRTVLITGISPNSIGSALADALASQSPKLLILASRTLTNIQDVIASIHAKHLTIQIEAVILDLSEPLSIHRAAEKITRIIGLDGSIDILFNNAGINSSTKSLSETGLDLIFATNHLGPFLFTNLLLPSLLRSKNGMMRVVNTSSDGHVISPVRFSDINQDRGNDVDEDERPVVLPGVPSRKDGSWNFAVAYGQSKTANVLFSVDLNRRYGGRRLRSFAVNPGIVMTNLARGLNRKFVEKFYDSVGDKWKSSDQGAATLMVAGFDPALDGEHGVYLDDCQMHVPARWASDEEKAQRLWALSEELVGKRFGPGQVSKL